ncbi:low temperature requirement protein A [Dactylosporangium sp. CA-139066]|uniref:low temperature requirement protein A n=1 Tax=Dactylosporangium sp. CA-139066 TaxID=3239930 RepID=UPI003D93434B
MATPEAAEERHATWLELFFDLVIVAAVAQLAHLLHDGISVDKVGRGGAGHRLTAPSRRRSPF